MTEENVVQKFGLKNIDKTRNYFIEETKWNEFMSKKHKKIRAILIHIEHLLILTSTITGCISISAFPSLIGFPIGILSSAIGLKTYAIATGINKYKLIIKEKKKNE